MSGIDDVLSGECVRSVLQPIVDLDTGEVVAYEAWPVALRAPPWSGRTGCSPPRAPPGVSPSSTSSAAAPRCGPRPRRG